MKLNGHIKLHRKMIEKERDLNDAELRLYLIYARIVDWDSRHQYFSSTDKTIRQIKTLYLPNWATGKISYTTRSLIKKHWLLRDKKRVYVTDYGIFRSKTSQEAEQRIQQMGQNFQPVEQDIQSIEQTDYNSRELLRQKMQGLIKRMSLRVQPDEQGHSPNKIKENINKIK